jgi:RimJ/RimL family protein N-acetyltransferase
MILDYPDPELTDGIVRVRPWRKDDIECVRLAATDPVIPGGTTLPAVFTPEDAFAYIERQWGRLTSGEGMCQVIADATTDEALGQVYVGVRPQPGVVGLGYWVVPDARRRGFATRAASLVSTWLLTLEGVARVEAWVLPNNAASLRVSPRLSASSRRPGSCARVFSGLS